ncbi:MAG: aminotransferase class I/II-fold pyridoxal phosphate-dependent enzyme [Thermoguttaceae bacterium]
MDRWPNPPLMEGPPGALTRIDGKEYLYFGGTGYLGLAGHAEVIHAGCEALRGYGIHTSTSRSGYGNSPLTLDVERLAAEFFGTAGAFYFASGYAGNHILIQAVADRADVVLADESAHFCLAEASHLLGRPLFRFRHRDAEDLRQKLREHLSQRQKPLVLTDGVFSMTGAVAPLDRYVEALRDYGTATLVVDDAHGIGTIGRNGRGSLEHLGLWGENVNADPARDGVGLYVCGTLSKAIGGFGGILPGSLALLDRVRQTSHYYDGASAPMSAAAGATAKALEIVLRQPELRHCLDRNARRLRGGLRALGLAVDDWPTPIIGLSIGSGENMRRIHDELRLAGIIVPYFAAYCGSGPAGRLRIAVFAAHTEEMLDRLLAELRRVL